MLITGTGRPNRAIMSLHEATGMCKTSQKHAQSLNTITYAPLLALKDQRDAQSISQSWNVLLFDTEVS